MKVNLELDLKPAEIEAAGTLAAAQGMQLDTLISNLIRHSVKQHQPADKTTWDASAEQARKKLIEQFTNNNYTTGPVAWSREETYER